MISPMELFPAHLGNNREEDIEGKRPSPIFNKIWCYFSLSVMPLLLQIGLVVKGIDCEAEPQLGLKRKKYRWRDGGCELFLSGDLYALKKHVLFPLNKVFLSTIL